MYCIKYGLVSGLYRQLGVSESQDVCLTCHDASSVIGRRFFTRCHLSVCNMHYPPLAGIDYVSKGGKKNDQELYRLVCILGRTLCTPRTPELSLHCIWNAAQHETSDKYVQPSATRHVCRKADRQRHVSGRRGACHLPPASWLRAATRTTRTTATSCGTQVLTSSLMCCLSSSWFSSNPPIGSGLCVRPSPVLTAHAMDCTASIAVHKLGALTTAGQGGNDLLGNKQQIADQAEKYGNAALVSSLCFPSQV